MRLCAVVAPNGLGHFRRVVRLASALLERLGAELHLTVVAEAWQRQATSDWPLAEALWRRAGFVEGVMGPGVQWSADPHAFDDGRLLAWEDRLANVPAFREATHVWSDNLSGVLRLRPDAFLSGSFLWSDVLSVHAGAAVAGFVAHERKLLEQHVPSMICVEALVMPGVRSRTRAVPVPWMCEWQASERSGEAVGVLGGRTGTAADRLARAAGAVEGRRQVLVDDALTHDAAGYGKLAAAILRPGAGSITDCVASGVPMLLLEEPDNPELRHNALAVQALGLGRVLPRGEEQNAGQWIAEMTDSAARRSYAEAFAAQRKNGVAAAAEWMAQHLNTVH